jgi:septum formation protein
MIMQKTPTLILASSSITRRALLDRLNVPYQIDKPEIDEQVQAGEHAAAACLRLAQQKARTVALRHPQTVVIGSDQLVACGDNILGKPHSAEQAFAQLRMMSGQTLLFHVAVAVIDAHGRIQTSFETVTAQMRDLNDTEITHYIARERPFDCAGSMKSEGLGIALLESMQSCDPTAIMGLPLIATARLLRDAGINPLG